MRTPVLFLGRFAFSLLSVLLDYFVPRRETAKW